MTSLPNTEPEPGAEPATENLPVPVVAPAGNTSLTRVTLTPADVQVADLQSTLEREREGRVEERWTWLAASGLLFVMLCYSAIGLAAGTMCAVIYLTVLAILGKRWGIDGVLETLATVHNLIGQGNGGKEEDNGNKDEDPPAV